MFKYFLHHMFELREDTENSLILFRCTGNPPVLSRFTRSYGRFGDLKFRVIGPVCPLRGLFKQIFWGVKIRCSGEIARHFFSTLPYIATTKNWVLFFLQYRGNDLLIFQDEEAKEEAQREKKLASLCRYPSHSSWWKSDVHCLFVFYIHPLRTINKPLPNLLYKESNDTSAKNNSVFVNLELQRWSTNKNWYK